MSESLTPAEREAIRGWAMTELVDDGNGTRFPHVSFWSIQVRRLLDDLERCQEEREAGWKQANEMAAFGVEESELADRLAATLRPPYATTDQEALADAVLASYDERRRG